MFSRNVSLGKDNLIKLCVQRLLRFPWTIEKLWKELYWGPEFSSTSPIRYMIMKYNQIWQVYTVTEVRYDILQRREATHLVLHRILLKNTESISSIIFSIKNLIRDKRKSTGMNCWRYIPEYRLDLLWEIIWQLLNVITVPRFRTKSTGIDKKNEN